MIRYRTPFCVTVWVGLLPMVSLACFTPPHELTIHHAELVSNSNTIVLARVVGGGDESFFAWAGKRQRAKFETVEVLRGNVPDSFSLPNGILGLDNEHDAGDFNGHRDSVFWDKQITRQWNMPDCEMLPVFFKDRTYLIFLDHPHWRAYEEIRSKDDLWLSAVRKLIEDSSLTSGVSMNLKE